MTLARRIVNTLQGRRGAAVLLLAGLCAATQGHDARACTTERVVTDSRTGLAMYGFDPVSYFVDGLAAAGRADFEFRYRGAVWRFRNPGNLAAFMDNPTLYAPQFGGYDPVAVGRGAPAPGNPQIWLIADQKLYLFYSIENEETFKAAPQQHARLAEEKWPGIVKELAQ
jgi:YHS domain-containing protein